ncbi:retinal-binding protein-like [Mizuhopecten yessoensis]|uniref:Retinal-binding protein n=1 Tax=Mizuhopecten yessoensis TaxID=6573 RepID=A0A210Q1V1_MIZYE|nr:retinal-binding protein-like [Mizuhopecten yessoensis]XP_021369505.1 retinal-binding protein-like [Mizuhopecten yessoensis]XP_021369506.1 retinal-binding protein-like [Mizuhopecten yessoensis]OWF42695.1 Retinal-binding protein [Mizuhopecten yessoensis]
MSKKKYNLAGMADTSSLRSVSNGTSGTSDVSESKENIVLNTFKGRIEDIIKPDHDDYYLRKWLKARCFDVDKAEAMYRTSMAFRDRMNVDRILQDYDPPLVLKKYLTGGFLGHAMDGSQIRVELFGRLDIKGIMCSVRKSDLEKTKIVQCEMTVKDLKERSLLAGKRVDGLTVIFDMEGVSTKMLWRPGMQMYLHLVKLLEDNYPEMMRRLLVINAPKIFPLLYKLARPLISDDMKDKIHIAGGDYKELLFKYIDPRNIPACYGGTLTDPDGNPRCVKSVCQGGNVPESYYLQNTQLLEHMKTVTIPKGDKLHLEYNVEKQGSLLRWEFQTDDYDIGFGVSYKENGHLTPLVPVTRVNSHVVTEDGSITCDKQGVYCLCFDNSFSWTKGKRVNFMAEVIAPDDTLIKSEINALIEKGDWQSLSDKFETTHL